MKTEQVPPPAVGGCGPNRCLSLSMYITVSMPVAVIAVATKTRTSAVAVTVAAIVLTANLFSNGVAEEAKVETRLASQLQSAFIPGAG